MSEAENTPTAGEQRVEERPTAKAGCRSRLRGWAGAHLHGSVRPRQRAVQGGRPPRRWC